MERFEYKTILTDVSGFLGGKVDRDAFERQLNAMGAEGWELVSTVATTQSYGSTRVLVSVFKRRKP